MPDVASMIAAVALDMSIGKEFDYAIPPQLEGQIFPGARVKVPFGPRQVLGSVVQIKEKSEFPNLKPIVKLLGSHSRIPPKIMQLAQWIADYYCCSLDVSLKAVLPDSVRQEEEGWRERLTVRSVAMEAALPQLTSRQKQILEL
ncbi:MAG: primosomal protein N', partial [Verrucomicrobiales bacterium]